MTPTRCSLFASRPVAAMGLPSAGSTQESATGRFAEFVAVDAPVVALTRG